LKELETIKGVVAGLTSAIQKIEQDLAEHMQCHQELSEALREKIKEVNDLRNAANVTQTAPVPTLLEQATQLLGSLSQQRSRNLDNGSSPLDHHDQSSSAHDDFNFSSLLRDNASDRHDFNFSSLLRGDAGDHHHGFTIPDHHHGFTIPPSLRDGGNEQLPKRLPVGKLDAEKINDALEHKALCFQDLENFLLFVKERCVNPNEVQDPSDEQLKRWRESFDKNMNEVGTRFFEVAEIEEEEPNPKVMAVFDHQEISKWPNRIGGPNLGKEFWIIPKLLEEKLVDFNGMKELPPSMQTWLLKPLEIKLRKVLDDQPNKFHSAIRKYFELCHQRYNKALVEKAHKKSNKKSNKRARDK
jgi:hypothetical protein